MKQLVVVIVLILFVFPLFADVSDSVWNALIDRQVIVEKLYRSEVRGPLIGVGDFDVNVMKDDGTIVTVERGEVEGVRGVASKTEKSSQSVQTDIPPGSTYFLISPLGLLQTGPIFEYGFLVSPKLYVAPRIRILGLGLLTQVLAGAADDDWMRIYSFSAGVGFTLASDWYYVDDPDTVYTSEEFTYFVGGIETRCRLGTGVVSFET